MSTIMVEKVEGDAVTFRWFSDPKHRQVRLAEGVELSRGWYDVRMAGGVITRAEAWPTAAGPLGSPS